MEMFPGETPEKIQDLSGVVEYLLNGEMVKKG